ncbi:MAG: histidinol-phosphate transaminase [Xanthomonadales bacterium]|nr:histidinol-phosphate transaminase [Xanthomonadales bacterium]
MGCDYLSLATPGVQGLHPYLPGKPIAELEREYGVSNIIKLASNENPLGSSPAAIAAVRSGLDELWLYPDANGFELKQALSRRLGLETECITLGNGSNDVLVLLAEAWLSPEHNAVFSEYCFAVYPIATQAAGAEARIAPALAADSDMPLGHDLQAMTDRIDANTRLVFVANPNNPTGTWLDNVALRDFVANVPETCLVIIDEAYLEYAGEGQGSDAAVWLADFPNLVVTRTFSKAYGLAGMRVGYALSNPQVAAVLNRVRQPFNVNGLALLAAEAALEDADFLARTKAVNDRGMQQLRSGLLDLGLGVIPSAGNFILVDMQREAMPIYDALLRKSVIVRPVGNYGLDQHLRITIGTQEQNATLLAALADVYS